MKTLFPTPALLLTALAVLGACDTAATQNANTFSVQREGEVMTGIYDPAGFTEIAIRDLLKFDCPSQRLSKYSETPGPRQLITFSATCAV